MPHEPDFHGGISPQEAKFLQNELRHRLDLRPLPRSIQRVGGLDVSYRRDMARAAAVVLDEDMQILEKAVATIESSFPYVPGLLSFREVPALIAAIQKLSIVPDVWICDAHGLAHPRRFGLACHLGIIVEQPTVGCAKSILVGDHPPLPEKRGSWVPLMDGDETIGAVVRTRDRVKPMIVSAGNRSDLESAVEAVLDCGRGLRLPEPTRLADKLAAWPQKQTET